MSTAITVEGYDPTGAPGLTWIKSSKSNQQHLDDSIGFAVEGDNFRIGVTTDPTQVPLTVTRAKLLAMLEGAKAGEFDHLVA
ncbi:DUF397 domain-containing protein [Kitasatospora sp. RB6PN24]|uniref:DUF397 domain-containing protein n=1 Tax=Kitasatospora humi TaxID=2893891 RepID=UPI001E55762D|nr:DUF397 domain-containing protein [Kitasatospora humi]MCC9307658.1 DUF397 domain-containing protein [Kitasatospora humi]